MIEFLLRRHYSSCSCSSWLSSCKRAIVENAMTTHKSISKVSIFILTFILEGAKQANELPLEKCMYSKAIKWRLVVSIFDVLICTERKSRWREEVRKGERNGHHATW